MPLDGDVTLRIPGSSCNGEPLSFYIDPTEENAILQLDGCKITCQPRASNIQMQVQFITVGSNNSWVEFSADDPLKLVSELTDLKLSWAHGILNRTETDFDDTLDIPVPDIDYDWLPLSSYNFVVEMDNPHPMGGAVDIFLYGAAPPAVHIDVNFVRGMNTFIFNEDNSDLLFILRNPPDSLPVNGKLIIGDGTSSEKWYPDLPFEVSADLTIPLSFASNETFTLTLPADSIHFEDDVVDTLEPEFIKADVIAYFSSQVPTEVTVEMYLARDSLQVYDNPDWTSEELIIQPGLVGQPQQTNITAGLGEEHFYLLQKGALWYGAKLSLQSQYEYTWNTRQNIIMEAHLRAIKRFE
jgi:hypothetical protein